MRHDLKIESHFFNDILDGRKTWELRKNDRNFRCGDILDLHEIDDNGEYTGRECTRTVRYVFNSIIGNCYGLCDGYCIMSIE